MVIGQGKDGKWNASCFNEKAMKLDEQRKHSRSILNQLSVGERFMLMFGRGELKHDPLRVEWKRPKAFAGCNTCLNLAECHKSGYCVEQMAKQKGLQHGNGD